MKKRKKSNKNWKYESWDELPNVEPKLLPRYLVEGREIEKDKCPICESNRHYKFNFFLIKLGKTIYCISPECPNGINTTHKKGYLYLFNYSEEKCR